MSTVAGSGYFAYLSGGTELRLDRGDDVGGLVNLGTYAFTYYPKVFYNIVLEATGTTIRAKVWEGPESSDPGVWHIDVIDGTYTAGAPGLVGLDGTTVDFDVFAAGIGGLDYPTGRFPGTPEWITPEIPFTVPASRLVALAWTRPSMTDGVIGGDVTYELQYRRNGDQEYIPLTTTIDPIRSYSWDTSSLVKNDDYCVRVRCLVACEAGPWNEICTITVSEEPVEDCPEDQPEEGIEPEGGIPAGCEGGAQVVPSECDGGAADEHELDLQSVPTDFETGCGDGALEVVLTTQDEATEPDSNCP